MPRLRIKLELNPGGEGVRLDKLSGIAGEVEKFLRSLANDCGALVNTGEWIAHGFYNSSVGAEIEHFGSVPQAVFEKFNEGVSFFANYKPNGDWSARQYSESTVQHFVDIGTKLDAGEVVKLGLFNGDDDVDAQWQQIAKRVTSDVEDAALRPVTFHGSVQGRLGTWFKESDFIYIRDAVTETLVKCFYKADSYDMIYRYYRDKGAVVHVSGQIKAERLSGRPIEIHVENIESYERLSDAEFEAVFGSVPDLIGDEPVGKYLDRIRANVAR